MYAMKYLVPRGFWTAVNDSCRYFKETPVIISWSLLKRTLIKLVKFTVLRSLKVLTFQSASVSAVKRVNSFRYFLFLLSNSQINEPI